MNAAFADARDRFVVKQKMACGDGDGRQWYPLFEAMPEYVFVSSECGNVIFVNRSALAVTGLSCDQIVGKRIEDFIRHSCDTDWGNPHRPARIDNRRLAQRARKMPMQKRHVVLALAYGLYDPHIRRINRMITSLLVRKMKAERSNDLTTIDRLQAKMGNLHVAIDWATGISSPLSDSDRQLHEICNRLPGKQRKGSPKPSRA